MGDADLIFAGCFWELSQHFFDLAWEYVDALDLYHVVGPSHNDVEPWEWAAARAFSRYDTGQIVGAVADERRAFFYKSSDDDLPKLSVRYGL